MAILGHSLLNELGPLVAKMKKNKTTFIIKIPPIYIDKVALFSSFDPFKGPKPPFRVLVFSAENHDRAAELRVSRVTEPFQPFPRIYEFGSRKPYIAPLSLYLLNQ